MVWFAMGGLDATWAAAAERLGYQPIDGEWRRQYPADSPHLDRSWRNFSRSAQLMIRQAAHLEPVRYEDALSELCRRANDIDWWLTGSAAVAVRGGQVSPGDIDVVCSVDAARQLGDIFADFLVEPVAPAINGYDGWVSEYWGRAFYGARIEWAGGVRAHVDDDAVADFGPTAAKQLETVRWRNWDIRVPPLALQRDVSARRGLTDRVAVIDQLLGA